jgi:DNA-binding transcriptional MerR regulator
LLRLRDTGMSIADIQRFVDFRRSGESTVADRLALLREHRTELAERIRAMQANAVAWDNEIFFYERMLEDS